MPDFSPAADTYLSRLSSELRDVREPLRGDIWSGVAEELDGLPDDDARGRIAELGDPAFIAREAVEAADVEPPRDTPSPGYVPGAPVPVPVAESRGFAIAGAITLGIGGFVVPFVGWIVGVGLVTASPLWRRRDKAIAILAPLVVVLLAAFVTHWIGGGLSDADARNPLVPVFYDYAWTSIVGAALLNVVAMAWLLVRLRRR